MSIMDIANGSVESSVQPGWSMGPFYPTDDLRFTNAFEIKNWDHRGVRSDWRDHPNSGSEYIAVISGTLTVVLGKALQPDGSIAETECIAVTAGHVIVLRAGQWRRYECTPDVVGISVRRAS